MFHYELHYEKFVADNPWVTEEEREDLALNLQRQGCRNALIGELLLKAGDTNNNVANRQRGKRLADRAKKRKEALTKMKRIFICSPYAGDVEANMELARKLCRKAIEAGYAPFAPHLLYPSFVDDSKENERAVGITCGLTFMEACDELWVYAKDARGATPGMKEELLYAATIGIRVKYLLV